MVNRIEKAREVIARAKAIAITVKRPFEEVLAEEICQLFPQPLDDKELREKVERILDELLFSPGESEDGYTYNLTGCIDQILALLQPKIGEGGLRFSPGISGIAWHPK